MTSLSKSSGCKQGRGRKPLPRRRKTMTMTLDDILRFELELTEAEIEEVKRILFEE